MNWAEERARELEGIFNCTSSCEPLVKAIAAELQRVANECIEVVDNKRKDLGKTRDHIDMRLPRSIDRLFENPSMLDTHSPLRQTLAPHSTLECPSASRPQ